MSARKGIPGFAVTVVAAGCAVAQLAGCGSAGTSPAQSTPPAASAAASQRSPAVAGGGSAVPSAGASSPGGGGSAGPPESASPGGGSYGGGSGQAALRRCTTSALRVRVDTQQAGVAAGTSYYPVNFVNISGRRCGLFGFPGVSFAASPGGSQIGAPAARDSGFGSVLVALPPGGAAHAWLGVANAANYPPSACHPVRAHWLRVYPPNDFSAAFPHFTQLICATTPHGGPQLTILPVRSGSGVRGSVP